MTASEQLREMSRKSAEVKTKKEELGINEDAMRIESEKIQKLVGAVAARCYGQLSYDIYTNVPLGVLSHWEVKDHALKSGAVSALGEMLHWDIIDTLTFCADLLDDVNAHSEADQVRKLADHAKLGVA